MRRALVVGALGALAGVPVAAPAPAAPAEKKADTVVEVGLTDYEFTGLPATVTGPKLRFDAVNRGPSDHELEILDEAGEALGEIEAMPAGESASMDIELAPGVYTIQCILPVGDDTDDVHADRGMLAELEVE